jgi:putative hydrolase of the HAD superfamily
MNSIKAIGFDLFNTLITIEPHTLTEATDRLIQSLRQSGFTIEEESFIKTYREMALKHIKRAIQAGRETHNSLWLSDALSEGKNLIAPDDLRVGKAIEQYFSAFYGKCHLIPGTTTMLDNLKHRYPLGLLSNFTHGPAAREILKRIGLNPYFKTILISGELGYRKPNPLVFQTLTEQLGASEAHTLYVGDDPDSDINGAQQAGLQPVWTTYVRDNNIPQVRGLLQSQDEQPDFDAPRISSWYDLFLFLEQQANQ